MPVFRLTDELLFPPPHLAEDGLLAVGGDLSTDRLLLAYSAGIFPWYSEGDPILWWSPDPRMVLHPDHFHCSRSLQRVLKKGAFRFTLDTAFDQVIRACAATPRPGQDGTWINDAMTEAYQQLHARGFAHSVECWNTETDELVGGLYGLSLGAAFFGESMFSWQPSASKAAMAILVDFARANGLRFIDCQLPTDHLRSLGAREMPRRKFLHALEQAMHVPTLIGPWRLPGDMKDSHS
jgi:leucyl/phenylalanyl-tRNA--protein transferase